MEVRILREAGYEEAVAGIGLSFGVTDFDRLEKVAYRLADKSGGHNKFLEAMVVWLEIRAARYWWQEFDTYRVGTTKQSESTIHTITRSPVTMSDFEYPVSVDAIKYLNSLIEMYKEVDSNESRVPLFNLIKANLPEGYLQKRIVCTNYKVLANMICQRRTHKLAEWHKFIDTLKDNIIHKDLLFKGWDKKEAE